MKLELHRLRVRNLTWGAKTALVDGVLSVDREELMSLLATDGRFLSVSLDLALPGDSLRILPVKDVVEPRCKIEGPGEVFPGFIGDVEPVGEGATRVLEGTAVVTCGKIVGFQEGIIDMSGPGADYTPFSRTCNVVVTLVPVEGLDRHEYESACRMAGFRAAHYLARSVDSVEADRVETVQWPSLDEAMTSHPGLPKVAYLYMLQSQGLLHDTYLYGVDVKRILPTLVTPTEVMDGAIVSGNCVSACDKNSTYAHQNNPVITALIARHGREINFVGAIVTNENVTLADKRRSSGQAVKLARMLGVEGLVISEEGFGNPDADLIMNCRRAERAGIRTVLITDEFAGSDGASQSLADAATEATAVVSAGNANARVVLPPMERVIGFPVEANVIAGGFDGSLRDDGSIEVELQAITGATSELGLGRLSAATV